MRHELCIAAGDFESLQANLLPCVEERCAVLFASKSRRSDGQVRFLVREISYPEATDYTSQGTHDAELTPGFVARVAKQAVRSGLSLVFVHTHPGAKAPVFSPVDNRGERVLSAFLTIRCGPKRHAALVMSAGGLRARILGTSDELRVVMVGPKRSIAFDPGFSVDAPSTMFDRQVRAFGALGQQRLESIRVAIVGLGGTGSIAAQQLVHLGVRHFILVDPDTIEEVNLNRVVGATVADIGSAKVSVAAKYIRGFSSATTIFEHVGDVVHDSVARKLIDADLILSCTDSHGSRAVLQQIAYQHLIPCIDMGSTITQSEGRITGIFGRIQMLAPGLPCLWCSSLLDAEQVRRDMMNEPERRLDPYIPGSREPAPSVVSLNGTVVSLAVSMLLGAVAGAPFESTHLIYNGCASSLRAVRGQAKKNCFICSRAGAIAWGSDRQLFTRLD
ncbi:HesA/MoeB/ThiF family protein [Trinickia mobilis]|uniref:HesA/MoeB/ThiF family protein n=1 Tax=Trinickia mobilis TaxID=2816356 RepID=UPI001A8FA0D6|nr:ThiF family adenylyltransferase [Trinickia mobilis]